MSTSEAKPLKQLYTLPETAEILGRSIHAVRSAIWRGKLAVVREGTRGKQWVAASEIERYIEEHTFRHPVK